METLQKIKPNGELKLPQEVMRKLKLKVGEKVRLEIRGNEITVQPVKVGKKNITKKLSGSIKLHDPKLIDEIISSEEWL